ncbi:MAG: hypothetical protein ACUVV0_03635 [Anaerolineae bacterium]
MLEETVIRADESVLLEIRAIARQDNRTLDEIIGEALAEYLERRRAEQKLPRDAPPFAGIFRSSEGNIAQRAEEILAEEWRPD